MMVGIIFVQLIKAKLVEKLLKDLETNMKGKSFFQ